MKPIYYIKIINAKFDAKIKSPYILLMIKPLIYIPIICIYFVYIIRNMHVFCSYITVSIKDVPVALKLALNPRTYAASEPVFLPSVW